MPSSPNRRFSMVNGVERRCTQCHVWFPEATEHFAYNNSRQAFNSWCKPCVRSYRAAVVAGASPRRGSRSATSALSAFDRPFGVELEFHGSMAAVATQLRAHGLQVLSVGSYTHTVSHTAWKIVPDGSVSNGGELVSPVLSGENGREQVRQASAALIAAGATVDRQCGLHVHHDVRNLRVSAFTRLVRNWMGSQAAIDGLVSASRRNGANTYCAPFNTYEIQQIENRLAGHSGTVSQTTMRHAIAGLTRYKALNLQSYPKYGTVEVRQHQGTVEASKILAWIEFGQAMIASAVAGTVIATSDTASLIAGLPLTSTCASYLTERASKLSQPRRRQAASA